VRFLRFRRTPEARLYWAPILWVITAANVAWGTLDVRRRYDAVVEAQTFRMQCQVSGGSYGAIGETATGCYRRAGEAEAQKTR
jgi:hypothetical protein